MKAAPKEIHPPPAASFLCEERLAIKTPFYWHYHPEFELALIIHGRGRRFIADHIGDYRDGDLVLMGPNVPHAYCPDAAHPPQPHVIIQFGRAMVDDGLLRLPELTSVADLLAQSSRGLVFTGRARREAAELIAAMPHMHPGQRLLALFSTMLRLAGRGKPLASPAFQPVLKPALHRKVDAICAYISRNFRSEIRQREMADRVGMGPQSFSRFFKRATGKTLTAYVNELRVGVASRLLLETDLNALQVCHHAGFNNFSNFVRQFRRRKKLTPAQFRRKHSPNLKGSP